MHGFRKITWAGFGWLTAIMTLIAGLPHYRCQCPNGAIKPFCFGIACSASGCCCGGTCEAGVGASCSKGPGAPSHGRGKMACCCTNSHGRSNRAPSRNPQVENGGCVRTLAQQHLALSPSAPTVPQNHLPAFAFFTPTVSANYAPGLAPLQDRGLHLSAAPPPDLVILLQRFLI